jgi:hypothetical protein
MKRKKNNEKEGLFKGVFLAYAILILHVILIAGLGLLVFFFSGMVHYMGWILLAGIVIFAGSAYYFYRRMKEEGKNLKEMIKMPLLNGRSVEVSVMGGLASFKIGKPDGESLQGIEGAHPYPLLEDQATVHIRELKELVRLLEGGLITRDEYDKAKEQLLKFD